MKNILFLFTLLGLIALGSYKAIEDGPSYYYKKIINANSESDWFSLKYKNKKYLKPGKKSKLTSGKEVNKDLWQKFHFSDLIIPLPIKNPFYFVAPIFDYRESSGQTNFGISIYNAEDQIISEIYFLPNIKFPNYLNTQKVFRLPLFRKKLKELNIDKVWTDAFTKKINSTAKNLDDIIYNLYLLNFRAQLLPSNLKNFRAIEGTELMSVEVEAANKDYNHEIIFRKKGNILFSFLIKTARVNIDAQLIRYKFLKDMNYQYSTASLGKILFREFQALAYRDKIDHYGMLVLLSSWSHNSNNLETLKTIVKHLERGSQNEKQLEPFYKYMSDRYGHIYATKKLSGLKLSADLILQRNIELEKQKNKRKALRESLVKRPINDRKNSFNELLDQAKKLKNKRIKKMTID